MPQPLGEIRKNVRRYWWAGPLQTPIAACFGRLTADMILATMPPHDTTHLRTTRHGPTVVELHHLYTQDTCIRWSVDDVR